MSGDSELSVEIVQSIGDVAPKEWDALVRDDDPFTTHAFLAALERSESASAQTGWMPLHVLCKRGGKLVGAAPVYLKNHSYGEYIFDWAWAESAHRSGIPYYPKLLCGVPFTPVTGRRLLVAPGEARQSIQEALIGGLFHLVKETDSGSLHILFCTEEESEEIGALSGMSRRKTFQYHWTHPGVEDFEAWLGLMRSKRRKTIRRERRIAQELGVEIQILRGEELTAAHWEALESFYRDTVDRKSAQAYLRPQFFREARSQLSHLALGILAFKDGEIQAGALAFQRGDHLFGRYWGCRPGYGGLHFEICYHQPIALCLKHNWTRFEAGAQGEHKISRGLLPAATHSLHWIRHPGLADAVEKANRAEQVHTEGAIKGLGAHGPFRR